MTSIFINYRRSDSLATAGRLHDRLAKAFGRQNIFMDVDTIPPGVDFVRYLDEKVNACNVLLAIIGGSWLSAATKEGVRRLDDPDDYVRIELASALKRDVLVIPVLIDGAAMPREDELPSALKPLARRNAIEVRNAQFHGDTERLLERIGNLVRPGIAARTKLAIAAAAAGAVTAIGWLALHNTQPATGIAALPPATVTSSPSLSADHVPAPGMYCNELKQVLAQRDRRYDALLGRAFGHNRIALVSLPRWEDCMILMENKFTSDRKYTCSLAGFADLATAEKATEDVATDLKTQCLGQNWSVARSFQPNGRRITRLFEESSNATITINPQRLATAPTWSVDFNIE